MSGRRWMASALLAAMVSSPLVWAQAVQVDDSILGDVAAQGYQVGNVNLNNDSVVVNGGSQDSAESMVVDNSAASAVNNGQNINTLKNAVNESVDQLNDQYALNMESSDQRSGKNTNNGSVVVNSSQDSTDTMILSNAASSSVNNGQNIARIKGVLGYTVSQTNDQVAQNCRSNVQYSRKKANLNNGSAVLNGSQNSVETMIAANSASSAVNDGQNILKIKDSVLFNDGKGDNQLNDQYAVNGKQNFQNPIYRERYYEGPVIGPKNTNNGSVVLNNSQNDVSGMILANSASSAVNNAQNIAKIKNSLVPSLSQDNLQVAMNCATNVQNASDVKENSVINPVSFSNGDEDIDTKCRGDAEAEKNVVASAYAYAESNSKAKSSNTNNGAVALNGSQNGAEGMILANSASSAVNNGQNIAKVSGSTLFDGKGDTSISQLNDQYACNSVYNGQSAYSDSYAYAEADADAYADSFAKAKTNCGNAYAKSNAKAYATADAKADADAKSTNVNNGSVVVNNSQNDASGMIVANSASSAVNNGQNIIKVSKSDLYANLLEDGKGDIVIDQSNLQVAQNCSTNEQDATSYAGADAIADAYAFAEASAIAEASCVAEARANASAFANAYADAKADATATNTNNGSVVVNNTQNSIEGMIVANSASSAVNNGQNIARFTGSVIGDGESDNYISQLNDQYAFNSVYNGQVAYSESYAYADSEREAGGAVYASASACRSIAGGEVDTYGIIWTDAKADATATNTNNGSVALSGSQNEASGMILANSASSAVNNGQNIATIKDTTLNGYTEISQDNLQVAQNCGTYNEQIAEAYKDGKGDAVARNTNNGSTVLSGSQNGVEGMIVANSASSAVNNGQNILRLNGVNGSVSDGCEPCETATKDHEVSGVVGTVAQLNDQFAVNAASNYQGAWANGPRYNTNNGSVVLNGSQNEASGMIVANSASSAVNNAQNIARVKNSDLRDMDVSQDNIQVAMNCSSNVQKNGTVNQNNGSVVLNNSQNDIEGMIVANSASSAVNNAQNIMSVKYSDVSYVSQYNDQYAYNNSNKQQIGHINKNNGSVVLNNAQASANTMILVNSANSAVNVGQNIMRVNGYSVGGISQINHQVSTLY